MSALVERIRSRALDHFERKGTFKGVHMLRGLAALSVALFHFFVFKGFDGVPLYRDDLWLKQWMSHGHLGVQVFFVISGFVIPVALWKARFRYRQFGRFLLKRSIRIEPPYIASFICIILLASYLWGHPGLFEQPADRFFAHFAYLIPFTDLEWYNIIYWTLAIEFQYYIFIALAFPLLASDKEWVRRVALGTLLIGVFHNGHTFLGASSGAVLFEHFPVFGLGITWFLFLFRGMDWREWLAFTVAFLVQIYVILGTDVGVASTLALAFIMFVHWDFKPGIWLGTISYSLYLTHGLVGNHIQLFYQHKVDTTLEELILTGVAVVASILFAALFWAVFEYPSQWLSRKVFSRRKKVSKPSALVEEEVQDGV